MPKDSPASLGRTSRQYVATMSVVNLAFFISQAYFIFYLQDNSLGYLQMSMIYALSFVLSALLGLPMGNLADRFGRRKFYAAGIAIMGVGMLIYAFTRTFQSFVVAEVFFALGWAMVNGANEAWVVDQLRGEGKGSEAPRAFTAMMSLSYILGVAGGVIASLLVTISLNMPFLGAALILFPCALLIWRLLPENYGTRVNLGAILKESLLFYYRDRRMQLLTAGETFRYIASVIYLFLYQPYLVAIGLGEEMLGVYFSLLMLCSATGSLLSPRLGERIGHHWVMVISGAGLFTGFALLSLSPGLAISCVLFALCGLSNGLGWPSLMVWRNMIVPSPIRASSLSLFSTFTYLAGAAMTLVLGALLDASDQTYGFIFAALIGGASIPLFIKAKSKRYQAEADLPLRPGDAQKI